MIAPCQVENPDYNPKRGPLHAFIMLTFIAGPVLLVWFFIVALVFSAWLQMILHMVYVWGDCVELKCMNCSHKRGFAGWVGSMSINDAMHCWPKEP